MNDKIYIHEFIDIRGHHRAAYMHHMAANWSPGAQERRNQLCFGVWAVLGSTGAWPQVVNLWEEPGWEGLAESFGGEAVGAGAQDPILAKWWAKASEFRRGGFDRIVEPAPWSKPIMELIADGTRGACYAHELVRVRPGASRDHLELVRERGAEAYGSYGWQLIGAFTTAMVNDDEAILLWAIPTWDAWAQAEKNAPADESILEWKRLCSDHVERRHRVLLVDSPLSPLKIGRQPARSDQVDWNEE